MRPLTKVIIIGLVSTVLCWTNLTLTYAAVPHLINYQGKLTDSGGAPLNGSYNLTFRLYDAETAGNLLWEETHSGIVIQKGIFSVLLGSVTNLTLAFDKQYFLEIKVGNEVMSPRQRMTSAGYAIRAEVAQGADKLDGFDAVAHTDPSVGTTAAQNKIVTLDSTGKVPISALPSPSAAYELFYFGGDGSDGDVIITQDTDISNSVKKYNNLTVEAGKTLIAKNSMIGVKGTLIVRGTISAIGGGYLGGTPNSPGTSAPIDEQAISTAAGGGGGGGACSNTHPPGGQGGSAGGSGGAGGPGGQSQWDVRPAGNGSPAPSSRKVAIENSSWKSTKILMKGAGGGGGGQGDVGSAGRGGAGGGYLFIEAYAFDGREGSIITAAGERGSDGTHWSNGGGGGGGGVLWIRYKNLINDSGIKTAQGGAGGIGTSIIDPNPSAGKGGDGGEGHLIFEQVK